MRIAIVDDHPVARHGVRAILAAEAGFDVVAAAGSVAELWDPWPEPDVVILDLYLGDGRLAPAEITRLAGRCAVLMMSASGRRDDVLAALRAGAGGYLVKRASADAYAAAVRTVAAGDFYVSPELADLLHVASADDTGGRGARVRLAPREREALSLIARGFTQAQAARRMGLSAATIDTYLKRVRQKIGPGNKADLTRRAIELGELDVPFGD